MALPELILAPFRLPVGQTTVLFAAVGALLTAWLTHLALRDCREPDRGWSLFAALAAAACCGLFAWCMLHFRVQDLPNVRPTEAWSYWRIGHHVFLISLMLAVTATDLRAYLIPDRIPWYGLVWAVLLAGLSGDLQIEHVWVDWNQEIPQIQGPFMPAWLALHPHWHGLAWSLAGATCGALGTLIIRWLASLALGQEAMGLGDVTLMAMIGAFLGWQPTLIVLILAPLCGLLITALLYFLRGLQTLVGAVIPRLKPTAAARGFLPYGPFLCLAAYIVILTWRWIWMFEWRLTRTADSDDRINTFAIRRLFGDWMALLLIAAVTLTALVVILFLRRIYKNLPVQRLSAEPRDDVAKPPAADVPADDAAKPQAAVESEDSTMGEN
ncbi:MAG: prepilin peptidase [Planctomycetaceae bacterium]|nr:prepilin peptidase [Planctomycetaceae bacterium]